MSVGTLAGGWFIANIGITSTPWLGAGFGILAGLTMITREVIDRKYRLQKVEIAESKT